MISGGIEINQFTQIRLILEVKFGDDSFLLLHNESLHTCNIEKIS